MKKLLLLVAGLLCVGLAQAGCEKGNCGDRTRDCGHAHVAEPVALTANM